ncbi:2,3-dihydro-2,3-dihydroxybenzoate dehydrogenase [Nocardia transvalensis]|uniref:2,3-dihydro-2,3-dihydroxybenzoate dehydrogenase n=1 Tax=Nocardia transvalensis TaxID=37333 RepID=A0A7W9PAF5_9NOCA|nr:2,3-dihydro-2,3-dihydroxybenzoate dehydrogenase [Nocardia transvalensis]MBB5912158.1 2,3-dihydro-2,3-dihydroxybenzoate dehydrogenase [Nocardia transvalensis]
MIEPQNAPDSGAPRVALVTGAAGGIGRRLVYRLASQGTAVVAVDRAADASKELRAMPGQVSIVQGDVADPWDVERFVSEAERDVGPIDYLVNAVGVLRVGATVDLTETEFEETFAVNTTGVFLVTRAVVARMIPRRRGAIVTVSSNAAHTPRASMSAYSASKAAATMLAKCAALEVAKYGIRCNVVSPGSTNTDMLRVSWADEDRSDATIAGVPEQFRLGIPLGRIADPDDIVDAVEFLLSDRARHITMQELTVDGGATLGS